MEFWIDSLKVQGALRKKTLPRKAQQRLASFMTLVILRPRKIKII
jgi:hypothetical protein